jgi:hypothetical protein
MSLSYAAAQKKDGDSQVLSGTKNFITNGGMSKQDRLRCVSGAAWDSYDCGPSLKRSTFVTILSTPDLTIILISPGVVIFPLAFPSLMTAWTKSFGAFGCSD